MWLCCGFVRMNTCSSKSVDNNSNVTLVLWLNRTAFCVCVCINTQNDNRNEQKNKHWFYCKFWFDGYEFIQSNGRMEFGVIRRNFQVLLPIEVIISHTQTKHCSLNWLIQTGYSNEFCTSIELLFFPLLCSSRVIKVKIERYLPWIVYAVCCNVNSIEFFKP